MAFDLAGAAVKLTRMAGALVWLSGLTCGWWAPHKPWPVILAGSWLLAGIGIALLTWRASK